MVLSRAALSLLRDSELAFDDVELSHPETGEALVATCGGEVISISGDLIQEGAPTSVYVVHGYFTDDSLQIPLDAPKMRLQLAEVEGMPALMGIPAQELFGQCRLFLIERGSESGRGVFLEVSGSVSCDEAKSIASELLSGSRVTEG